MHLGATAMLAVVDRGFTVNLLLVCFLLGCGLLITLRGM